MGSPRRIHAALLPLAGLLLCALIPATAQAAAPSYGKTPPRVAGGTIPNVSVQAAPSGELCH